MILLAIVIILVLVVAFFHSMQGFFSATLSAIIAVIAAAVALSFHEPIVEALIGGKMSNTAHGMVLIMLFTVTYLALRILVDSMVPGNIRLPAMVDKIGGGVMGLVAGAFVMGILMIALQEMPLGSSIMGYTRYETADDRQLAVPGSGQLGRKQMAGVYNELKSDTPGTFDESQRHSLYVDDLVVNTVGWLSNGGSLAGSQPLAAIHPDMLTELYGQRLGIEPGGKRAAVTVDGKPLLHDVRLDSLFSVDSVAVLDSEIDQWRAKSFPKPPATMKAPPDGLLLVVRLGFSSTASDPDWLVRLSPASVRLVAPVDPDSGRYTEYFPIGTLQNGTTLFLNKLDDPLFIDVKDAEKEADFVFQVKKDGLIADASKKNALKLAHGTFVEVKRLSRFDLSDQPVLSPITSSPTVQVLRKTGVAPTALAMAPGAAAPKPAAPAAGSPTPQNPYGTGSSPQPQPTPSPAPTPTPAPASLTSPQSIVATANNSTLAVSKVVASAKLPMPISTGSEVGKLSTTLPGGDAILKNDHFLSLNLDVSETVDKLSTGPRPIQDLLVPEGQSLIQVVGAPPDGGWGWAEKADTFALVDGAGNHYPPNGAWAEVTDGGAKKFVARYSANYPLGPITAQTGKVGNVWLCFAVPNGTEVKQLVLGTITIKDFDPIKAGQ